MPMTKDFQPDNRTKCSTKNKRLSNLLLALWNPYCVKEIVRKKVGNQEGWEATYDDNEGCEVTYDDNEG